MKYCECVRTYLNSIEIRNSKGTYDFYKQYLKYSTAYFGETNIEDITANSLDDYIRYQKSRNPEISMNTLNKHILVIKRLYNHSTDRMLKYKKLSEKKPLISTLDSKNVNKIFEHLEKNLDDKYCFRNYLYLRLLLDTGLRMNELNHVKICNINLNDNTIFVSVTKTGNDRYVVFKKETKKYVETFMRIYGNHEYLFYNFNNNDLLTTSSVESFISRLKKRLDIHNSITPHKWRHTFATGYLRNSGNIEVLRLILGHTNLETTQKYLHLNKKDIINDYNKVSNL